MNIYKSLAWVYHEMYQHLFDYDQEFAFYETILKQHNAKSVLELGCGTGNLASRFSKNKFDYIGIDLNIEMLDIARKNHPEINFVNDNMCSFETAVKQDVIIISGRSISYLTENQEVESCFNSIYNSLKTNGILIFDAIDAIKLFKNFDLETKTLTTDNFQRISHSTPNLKTGSTWDWESIYYIQSQEDEYTMIGKDFATLRAFTQVEIENFLKIAGFEFLTKIQKDSYTWEDHFYIAKKL